MIQVIERALFRMPQDKELLFPAVSAMQTYVNGYHQKMTNPLHDASRGEADWVLEYTTEGMSASDWDMFKRAGLFLKVPPGLSGEGFDVVFDMSDARILAYQQLGKHAVQACGILVGVEALAIPEIRHVRPKLDGAWHWIGMGDKDTISVDELLVLKDDEITGVIGKGWETYLAASMGLPTIELVPVDRPVGWLSKWVNGGYRVVVDCVQPSYASITAAKASVEIMLKARQAAVAIDGPAGLVAREQEVIKDVCG